MTLPKIDTPIYELDLPLSKTHIKFRPFLVREQKMLLIAMESDDKEDIERNIRQVLANCTLTEGLDIDRLPILDVEFYFINLRARSVGEIVENKYRCENKVPAGPEEPFESGQISCNNLMDVSVNLLDIKPETDKLPDAEIKITPQITVKMKYPEFSVLERAAKFESTTDMAFDMIIESIEAIWDGEQWYYAKDSEPGEMVEFVENLNRDQFAKIEAFFSNLPKLEKKINVTCGKCGFAHTIEVEGLQNFFG